MSKAGARRRASTGRAVLVTALAALVLSACSSTPDRGFSPGRDSGPAHPVDVSGVPDAVPHPEPRSKYGNPSSYVVAGHRYHVMRSAQGYRARGIASWYGRKFHGRRTSSGERYDMYAMTAAHKELPLPTYCRVTNLNNGRSVIVRVNDRGPFHENRIIDLSYAAARKLGMVGHGTAPVEVEAIDPYRWRRGAPQVARSQAPAAPAAPKQVGIYLQVGAFASRLNAERLRDRLQDEFSSIQIQAGRADAQPIYRVRIGPFDSADDVDLTSDRLGRFGITTTVVVD